MKITARRRISRDSFVIPRSWGDLVACAAGFGSYLLLGFVALVVACTDSKSPTGPSNFNFAPAGGARLAVGARVVYLGAARSKPVNFIRLRVYEDNTTNLLGTLDKELDPTVNAFDFNFVVSLGGRKLNTKITMELVNKDASTGKETVNYSGRVAQTPLAPGDIRQLEIDLYPGPLSNFDVTALKINKPIPTQIEGDKVTATAVVTGGSADTRIDWTSLDDNVASIDDDGVITTKLPGTARIVAALGLLADTATVTVKQRLTAVTITPSTITIKRGDSTTFVGKGVDPRGAEIVGEQVTWSVPADGIMGLTPTAGRAVGQRIGTGTVTVTSVSKPTLTASATVTIGPPLNPVKTIEVSPSTQTATAIGQTKTYTAVAKDAAGNVIKDVVFQWSSSSTAIATVSSAGVATAVAAGNATITAAVEEASGTAALLVRPPGMQLSIVSGNNQTGTVKTAAGAPVVAKVTDAGGNAVAGIDVTFATADVDGTVGTATATSNAQGLVSSTWTFGSKAGTQTVTASNAGLGIAAINFNATVNAGAPAQLVFITQPSTTAANRTAFGTQPVIEVRDQYGNPVKVAGNTITVTVASGGGTLTNATINTDATGRATFTALTLAGTVGLRSLSFGMTGVPSITAPVTLTAGTASTITIVSGNGGTGKVGTVYAPSPVVLVTDLDGNPVPDAVLTLTPGTGGGTVQPGTITTGPDGKATIGGWTLRPTPGPDDITVSTPGGTPVKITVTADPNPATQMAINGGSTSGQIGTALAVPPSVIVRDVNNIPVAGITVTFAVATGGGTITGATQVTNAQGIATVGSWTLGALPGANTMTAASGTLAGSPLTIAATGLTNAATQMALNGGSTSGTAGQAVATPPSVIIKDANGNPVQGVPVTFSVGTGGGSITGVNQVSNAAGIATLGSWTLGTVAGTNTVIATSAGLTNSPLTITATGNAGAATQMALNGGSTSGLVNTAVSIPPSVLVRDANNNPVAGVTVTFAVATGNGTITGATAVTNAGGIATVGSWTLGPVGGLNTLTATSPGLTNSPLTISASSLVSGATQMALNGGSTSGTAGQPVATPPSVIVKDGNNNPVAGVLVNFAVGTGGGSVTGPTQTTNAQGIATVGSWTLGANAGTNTIIATSTGLTGSPLTITATSTTAPATQIASYAGSVTGTVGAVVATNPAVIVRDAKGNPVAGVDVTFSVTGGGGSMTGTTQKTNANGIATVGGWTLGTIVGTNTATATSGTLTGSPVTFTVAASASTAATIAANGGSTSAVAGAAVATPPSVVVKDQYGNVVQGTSVTFAVGNGGGSITGATQTTDANGIATVGSWTMGKTVATNTLTANSTGLTGSPVTFTIASVAGPATQLSLNGGSTSGQVSTALAVPPSVIARDANNNPVSGVSVTFAVATGGGSATGLTQVTNASGIATVGSWTLGALVGANTMTATSGTLGGSPLTIAATALTSAATQMALNGGSTNGTAGQAVATPPSVIIKDASNNPVAGVPVTFSVGSGGGSITGVNQVSDANGIATLGSWTLGTVAGTNTVIATSAGLTNSPLTITATGTAGAATQMSLNGGSTSGSINTAVAVPPSVLVRDVNNNPVGGVTVTFAVATGGGAVTGATAVTNTNGIATVGSWTLGPVAGVNTVTATSPGLTNSPLTISASSVVTGATQMALNGGSTTGTAGQPVATPPSVIVKDANNTPVAGVLVTFAVGTGGGSVTGATQTTNAQGIATVGSWTLGANAGTNTIIATSTGLTGSPLTITATASTAPATQIASYAGSVTGTVGAVVATNPAVIVRDAAGNPVAGVTVTFAVTGGGGSMTGTTQVTNAQGIATVGGWTLGTIVGTNTATATSGTLTGSPVTFTVAASASTASQLAINAGNNQTGNAGSTLGTAPSVVVKDQYGNVVQGTAVTFAVTAGGGTITGAAQTTNANGVATVGSWTLGVVAGTNTLTATSTGLTGSPLAITATGSANAASLANSTITAAPTSITADGATTSTLTVQLKDVNGQNLTTSGGTVTITKTTGPAVTLSAVTDNNNGTYTATVKGTVAGAATFSASLGGNALTNASNPATVTLVAGAATKVAFTQQPTNAGPATALGTQPQVTVQDANGNTVTGSTAPITIALTTPAGATLTCTTNPVNATAGVATFAGCQVNLANTYTLTATTAGLTSATSSAFTIAAGVATKLVVTTQPSNGTSGTALATQPVFTIQDAQGNTVNSTAAVTVALTTPGGATLTCTTNPVNAAAGVATLAGCAVDKAGTYTMTATSAGLTSAVTSNFTIGAGAATKVVLTTQPSNGTANTALPTQPVATIQDAAGNTVTGSTAAVTLALTTPGGATLTCTSNPLNATAGVATFAGCKVDKTGTYTLTVTSTGLTSATSNNFTISAGAATKLVVTTQPSASTAAATAFAQQPVVTIQDAQGNTVTGSTAAVTLALTTGTGTLSGTATVNAVNGVATFAGLSINLVGTDKVLTATSAGLTSATTSPAFTITAGAATKVVFTTQPSASTAAGAAFAQQPVATIQDAQGNTVTSSTAAVTLALTTGTGTLSGTATVNATAGVATFSGLSINLTGTDKVLTATSAGLTSATTSPAFTITAGAATKVVFTTQPSASTAAGAAFAQQPVATIQDAQGNTVTGSTAAVTVALTTGSGTLSGTATVNATAGVATFSGLSINLTGTDKVLTATSAGLTSATTSPAFTITAGAATKVVVTTQPSASTVAATAFAQQPVVTIQDAQGNTVTNATNAVTLALTTGTGALSGTATVNAVNGVATFAGLSINLTGTDKVLTASATGLTSGTTSPAFTITAGTATKVAFTTQPSASTAAATAFAQQPVVTIQDAQGNTVTSATNAVTVALTTGTGTLSGTATVNATAGVATFAGLSINLAGTDKVLTATATGLTSATTSPAFTITAGAKSKLAFTTQPSASTVGGTAFAQQPVVTIQDAQGNTVSATDNVTLSLTTGTGTLSGTATVAAVAGVATFSGMSINLAGTNKVLTAAATGLTSATTSPAFTITAGALDHFNVTKTDSSAIGAQTAGTSFNAMVTARDVNNNLVTSFTGTVDMTTSSLFGAGGGTTSAFTAGVLSSLAVTLNRAGTNQTLTATRTSGGTETGTATFNVNTGAYTKLQVLVPGETAAPGTGTGKTGTPTDATAGTALTSIIVNAVDANWNVVTSVGDQVSLATTDGNATIPSAAFLSSGTKTFSSSLTLKTAGNQTITASDLTDVAKSSNTSPNINVVAGAASKYIVTANPSAGSALDRITVSAQLADANGNAVNTAGVTVNWTSNVGAFGTNGLQVASSVTNASGIAQVVDTLHAGANTTTATDGSSRTGNVTVTAAGTSSSITASWTNSGRVIVGGNTMTVSAQVVDGSGNPVAVANVPITFTKDQNDATSGYINNVGSSANTDPTVALTVNTNSSGLAQVTYTSGSAVGTLSFTISTTTAPMNAQTYSPGSGATINRPALYEVSLVPAAGTGGAANSVSGTVVVNSGSIIPAQIIQKSTGTQVIGVQAKLKDALGGTQVSLSSRTVTWTCSYDDGSSCSGTFTGGNTSAVASGQTVSKNFTLNLSASDTAGRKYIFTATDGSGAVAGLSSSPTGASGSPFVGSATVEGGITKLITGTVQNPTGSNPVATQIDFTTSNSTFPNIANDLLVTVLTFRGRTNSNDPRAAGFITTVPSGWTLLRKDAASDPNDLVTYVYTKIRGASAEPSTTSFVFSGQGYGAGVMFSMRGADTTSAGANLIDVSGGQANASGTSFATPSITTTHAKEKVVAVVTVDADGTGQQFSVPSGWSLIAKSDQTANSPMPTFMVIQRNVQTAGAVSATITGTTAGVSVGTILAIKQNTIP